MTERLYHEIACPTLTNSGPCACVPIAISNTRGDLLAWLDEEQKHPQRWMRSETGVLRFQLTLPELMRIRRLIEEPPARSVAQEAELSEADICQVLDRYEYGAFRNRIERALRRGAEISVAQETGLLQQIETILSGIDRDECESPDGWWPNGDGASFGAGRLAAIRKLFAEPATQHARASDLVRRWLTEDAALPVQEDLPADAAKVLRDNAWELYGGEPATHQGEPELISKKAQLRARWLVARKRETEPWELNVFDRYDQAAMFWDAAQTQWSDVYFCRVAHGPRDVVGDLPRPVVPPPALLAQQERQEAEDTIRHYMAEYERSKQRHAALLAALLALQQEKDMVNERVMFEGTDEPWLCIDGKKHSRSACFAAFTKADAGEALSAEEARMVGGWLVHPLNMSVGLAPFGIAALLLRRQAPDQAALLALVTRFQGWLVTLADTKADAEECREVFTVAIAELSSRLRSL